MTGGNAETMVVSFAHLSILVNGGPKGFFNMRRSIRQGDPLSPYLYVMVVESLHLMLHHAATRGMIHDFHVKHFDLEITHLPYADDTIFFLKADKDELSLVAILL